MTNAGW